MDQERAESILNQMEYMERAGSAQLAEVSTRVNRWAKDDRDHDLGRDSLEPVIEEALAARAMAQAQFIDALFAMKDEMSREEWEGVFGER